MYNIKTLNSISPKGIERLSTNTFTVGDDIESAEGILLRSANMHDMALDKSLLAIARAGAGVNNIPIDKCSNDGVVVFNTPGANANAVKELVLCALVLSSRNVLKSADWVKELAGKGDAVPSLVEKGKAQFVGPELAGKKIAILGLGAIGVKVANMAVHLDMEVYGYDPYLSVESAWNLSRSVKPCVNLSDILGSVDYISLHMPVNAKTKYFVNEQLMASMKHGVRILNFARAELIESDAMIASLKSGRVANYVVDFPTDDLLGVEGCISIPHLGASTPESEDNCAIMAVDQLSEYLLNGNIINSVNFPAVSQPKSSVCRICVVHKNTQGLLAAITNATSNAGLNIENMVNKSKNDFAYTVLDANSLAPQTLYDELMGIDDVIRVRFI